VPRDRSPNKPIGTCECPTKGCSLTCKVFRFRQRNEKRTRLAGLLYLECPEHGRIGADGKKATQEYILEHATIETPPPAPASESPAQPSTSSSSSRPAPAAQPSTPARTSSWLERLKTALD
jgi:hypothetical protein